MMINQPTKREASKLTVVLALFSVYAGVFVYRPATAWTMVDPGNFVSHSTELARSGNLFATHDPPLRYIGPAIAILLFEWAASPAAVVSAYALFVTWILVPISIWVFWRVVSTQRVAFGTLGVFALIQLLDVKQVGYASGSWQYDLALPLFFIALLTGHWAMTASQDVARYRRAAVTGLVLAYLGLHQITLACLAAAIIAGAFLAGRKVVAVLTTGLFGGIGSVLHLGNQQQASTHVRYYVGHNLLGPNSGLLSPFEIIPIFAAKLPNAVVSGIMLPLIYLTLTTRSKHSRIVTSAIIVTGGGWFVTVLFQIEYLPLVFRYLAMYLCSGALLDLAVAPASRPSTTVRHTVEKIQHLIARIRSV